MKRLVAAQVIGVFTATIGLAMGVAAYAQRTTEQPLNPEKPGSHAGHPEMSVVQPKDLKWMPAPPFLPKGAEAAILEGDPMKAGPYTLRLKMPAGYKVPPHTHPATEHVTVLKGDFALGMGPKQDPAAMSAMPTGSFAFMTPGMVHYAMARSDVTIQLHGTGPFQIDYVNPADDPRNAKGKPAAAPPTKKK
jgi:hypothetical protein